MTLKQKSRKTGLSVSVLSLIYLAGTGGALVVYWWLQ